MTSIGGAGHVRSQILSFNIKLLTMVAHAPKLKKRHEMVPAKQSWLDGKSRSIYVQHVCAALLVKRGKHIQD